MRKTWPSLKRRLKSILRLRKGEECHSHFYDEIEQVMLWWSAASYLRTLAHWEGREVKVNSNRPAAEDVLIYDRRPASFVFKTPYNDDMEQYHSLVCRDFYREFVAS
jgi:hypothetical protein